MFLRFTVRDTTAPVSYDLEVAAEPGSTIASLLDALPIPVGDRPVHAGPAPLEPGTTIGDSPLIAGALLDIGAPGEDYRGPPPGTVGALRGISGPDAGLFVWLSPGRHTLARNPAATVPLNDPAVSRRHASLDVSAAGEVTVADLGSANGTSVDGKPIGEPAPLPAGSVLGLGADTFDWIRAPASPRATRSPEGHLHFDRAFAPAPAISRTEVPLPQHDTAPRNLAGLLVSAALPLAFAAVMAIRDPSWWVLIIALLTPLAALVPYLLERRQRARRDREFTERKNDTCHRIEEAVAREERLRRNLAPGVADLTAVALGAAPGLWPRNGDSLDGLVLRVGVTDQAASIDLRGEPWEGFEQPAVRDVPATLDLRDSGVLGVAGPREPVDALTRWLVVQLATLRSPEDLHLVVLTADNDDTLAWTGWLPHVAAGEGADVPCSIGNTPATRCARLEELCELITVRKAQRTTAGAARFHDETVVVLDGALPLRHMPGMKELLREGPASGVYVICADRHDMNEYHGLCALDGTPTMRLTRRRADLPQDVTWEGVDRRTAERIARALTPMRDRLMLAGPQTSVPYPVRWTELVEQDVRTAEGILRRWAADPGPRAVAPLGADGSGVVTVDLARQGPHTMLAGATGAGKSVLLQTLVTALLTTKRPDELNLVLVDFKGGSAFLPFARCPHVVALIRSTGDTPADRFDEAAARRVLDSIAAERSRRESILARYDNIDNYWRARANRPELPALPRLVMIFDEFAQVLQTAPNFLQELVSVARTGRSLGIHLVLATQSLQGKLNPDLRNNISLRITLRQNEPADSVEVLGVPDAATIPGRLHGRGMILCTADQNPTPHLFQSGYLGDPPPTGEAPPARVRIVEWAALGTPRPPEPVDHGNAPTDLDLTVAATIAAAHRLRLPAPSRPLLPPLPADLPLEELDRHVVTAAGLPAAAAPYALLDEPAGQAQPAAFLDLAGTDRLLVAGGPQSGRTTVARTLITSLARRFRPDQVHLYVVEHQPAGLTAYAGLPHCGAVLPAAGPDRIRRLVTWLDGEVQRRTMRRFDPRSEPDPWIVTVIDGWEYFEDRGNPTFMETSLLVTLRGIITAGPPVGVHVVAIGGPDMMSGKLPGLYEHRILLPFAKADTLRQHLSHGMIAPAHLPGRAVDAGSGLHLQVCRPETNPEDLVAEVRATAAGIPPERLPRRFPTLPAKIDLAELWPPEPPPSPTWIPIGVGGPDVTTVGLDLFDAGPHLALISGPDGSGRTTAAATVAHGLRRIDVGVLAVAPPRSPLPRLLPQDAGVRVVTGTTIKDADLREAAAAFGGGPYAVIIDDCEQVTVDPSCAGFTEEPTLLQEIAEPDALGRRALVLCGDAVPILDGQRRSLSRVVAEIMSAGARVLLTPGSSAVARLHGFVLEPDQFFAGPPGRGHLAVGRTTTLVEVAAAQAVDVDLPASLGDGYTDRAGSRDCAGSP